MWTLWCVITRTIWSYKYIFYNDKKMTINNLIWIQMDIINYNMKGTNFDQYYTYR
jgi:hypothetical protein